MDELWTYLRDKPYNFVPINEKKDIQSVKMGHKIIDKELKTGKIKLKIEVKTPIHIGSGLYGKHNDEIAKLTLKRKGLPVIPGSSLKGVIRSICEAVSNSCAPELQYYNFGNGVGKKLHEALGVKDDRKCRDINNLCITCRMFGFTNGKKAFLSKISFSEFKSKESNFEYYKLDQLQSPFRVYKSGYSRNKGYGNERIYYCQICKEDFKDGENKNCYSCSKKKYHDLKNKAGKNRDIKFRGRKFYYHGKKLKLKNEKSVFGYYEYISKNTTFEGCITFENLHKEELSLLLFSLGLDNSFYPKIGYGKPYYFGSIGMQIIETEDYKSLFDNELNKDTLNTEKLLELTNSYYDSSKDDIKKSVDKLRKIFDYENPNGPDWKGGY